MPPKYEFDQTRNAIGVDNLKDDERKAMLDKFKSAGGKVLSERELKEQKKKEAQGKLGKPASASVSRSRSYLTEEESASTPIEEKGKSKGGAFTKLFLNIRTFMEGLTPFGAESIKFKFFAFLGLEVKQAIVEFNLIGNDLFLQNRNIGKKIASTLDQKNPALMELLQRLHSLFDAKEFNKLLEFHQSNPTTNIPFRMVEDSIKTLYRKLYYLYPYQETIKKALSLAVECYNRETTDENSKNMMEQKKKKFLKDLNIVFGKAFPKFFSLISRMDGVEYVPFSPGLERAINVNQDEKIGKRKKGENSALAVNFHEDGAESEEESPIDTLESEGESAESTTAEDSGEAKDESVNAILSTKEYQYGIKLMRQNPIPVLRKKHDSHNKFTYMQNNDRAFLAFLFFMEFDRELSFVLTTKKIKLNPDYSAGSKKDYKQIMADIFNQSRNIMQTFDNYMEARLNVQTLDKQGSGANYIEASKRKESAKKKMDLEGRNVRGLIRSYMDNVTRVLATLIADMKSTKAIVANMDEALNFDSDLEGSKRLNGQPVKQCILETYCYSLALNERLTNGDLFGGILEMTDEEMIASFGSAYKNAES